MSIAKVFNDLTPDDQPDLMTEAEYAAARVNKSVERMIEHLFDAAAQAKNKCAARRFGDGKGDYRGRFRALPEKRL